MYRSPAPEFLSPVALETCGRGNTTLLIFRKYPISQNKVAPNIPLFLLEVNRVDITGGRIRTYATQAAGILGRKSGSRIE